jgi:hypothetical protein
MQRPINHTGLTPYGDWRNQTHLHGRQLDHPKYGKPYAENNHIQQGQRGLESVAGYFERRGQQGGEKHWTYIQSHNKSLKTHQIHPLQPPLKVLSTLRINTQGAHLIGGHIIGGGDNGHAHAHAAVNHQADQEARDDELDNLMDFLGDNPNDFIHDEDEDGQLLGLEDL